MLFCGARRDLLIFSLARGAMLDALLLLASAAGLPCPVRALEAALLLAFAESSFANEL